MKKQLSPFITALSIFFGVQVIGIGGYMVLEGYTFVDALYMAIITFSTVGFGEVRTLTPSGKIFTIVLIVINFAIFAYFVSILSSYIFEGRLRYVFKRYMVDRKIHSLENHVIVCGFGRNGAEACKELERSGFIFVIIEKDHEVIESMPDKKQYHLVVGDATHEETLLKAHTEKASEILITTSSDADNVFIALSARKLNPNINIVARATQMETESKLYFAGANHVIMPDRLGGMFMAHMVTKPETIEFLNHLTGRGEILEHFRLESIQFDDLKPEYQNANLRQMRLRELSGCTVIGVKDDKKGIIPSPDPDTVIGPDDCMILLGSDVDLSKARQIYTKD